jgi:Cof subfamily protein (haloacid dehalogenase superfamily)
MDLSQIKMVVSDMDGTLLNSSHEVSDRFFDLFKELQLKGIQFVAASGRQYHSMVSKLEDIKDDILFIAENGALIKEKEKEISSTPLPRDLVFNLINSIQTIANARVMLCGKYTSFFDSASSQFLSELVEYYSNYEIIDDFNIIEEEIVKIALYHHISSEDYLYPQIQSHRDEILVKISGQHWLDINSINAHKGNALKKVMDRQGIRPNEVLVFGDYFNDLEMLQLVDHSFAMANAHPSIKKVANFETTSNDNFGVENILEKLL